MNTQHESEWTQWILEQPRYDRLLKCSQPNQERIKNMNCLVRFWEVGWAENFSVSPHTSFNKRVWVWTCKGTHVMTSQRAGTLGLLGGVGLWCTLKYSRYVHFFGEVHIYCKRSQSQQQQQQLIFLKEKTFCRGRTFEQLN